MVQIQYMCHKLHKHVFLGKDRIVKNVYNHSKLPKYLPCKVVNGPVKILYTNFKKCKMFERKVSQNSDRKGMIGWIYIVYLSATSVVGPV